MQVCVFHPGTQHSRQTALALQQLGKLAFLATGLFDDPDGAARRLVRLLPGGLRTPLEREMARFAFPALDAHKVRAFPQYELPERIARRLGSDGVAARLDTQLNAAFGKRIAGKIGTGDQLALWSYDGAAFAAFTDPRTAAVPKILDRTMAHGATWNAIRASALHTQGDWFADGSPAWSQDHLDRDEAEYAAADLIVCGSPFVMESLRTHSRVPDIAEKLALLPYPFDATQFAPAGPIDRASDDEPVRFLFVGQVSGRKGIRHVLEAIARLPADGASLTVVGNEAVPARLLAPYRDRVDFRGPVAKSEVAAIMRDHHAFVFPSYNEGSAIVLAEAMASGLAIIQTAAAGMGASKASGFVLDHPDTDLVETAMRALVNDRDRLHAMREAALEESKLRDFTAYREGVASVLERLGL